MSNEQAPTNPESQEAVRIQQLIESGEAFDVIDAQEALREEDDARIYMEMDPATVIPEIQERLAIPETEPGVKWDLNFRLAVIETAQTPEERVYLLYTMLLDLPFGTPRDENERRRQESTRQRLLRKQTLMGNRIGIAQSQELFNLYRIRLQKLFDEYFSAQSNAP